MQAAVTGTPVLVADLHHSRTAQRWPIFAAAVAEQTDVRALFALPLQWGTVNVGVLNPLFWSNVAPYGEVNLDMARRITLASDNRRTVTTGGDG